MNTHRIEEVQVELFPEKAKRQIGLAFLSAAMLFHFGGQSSRAQELQPEHQRHHEHEVKYLFICAGDQSRRAPDFLAVVNFDEESKDYGHVIAKAPVEGASATGNEFHHIGLSADGKTVACG